MLAPGDTTAKLAIENVPATSPEDFNRLFALLSRNGIHVRTLAQKAAVASVLPYRARAALLNLLGHDLHRSARIANDVTITGAVSVASRPAAFAPVSVTKTR